MALFISACTFAQDATYAIHVKMDKPVPASRAYLVFSPGWTNQRIPDSAAVSGNSFNFSGQLADTEKVSIIISHPPDKVNFNNGDALTFYLEAGNIRISGTDSISHATIEGGPVNEQYKIYYREVLEPCEKKYAQLNAAFKAASASRKKDTVFTMSLYKMAGKINLQQDSLKYVFISRHPESYMSIKALTELAGPQPNITQIAPYFSRLSPAIRNTNAGKQLAMMLYETGPTAIGATAPDFTEEDVNGNPVSLSDFRGKYVLLDFWASGAGLAGLKIPMF